MELSFRCETSAEASLLAQELESALRDEGIPGDAVSLKPASPENMDIGSVVWISVEHAANVLGPIMTITSFAKCVYEVATKYGIGVNFRKADGMVELPATTVTMNVIEKILSERS